VTPAITPAAVCVILRSNIVFCSDRNAARVLAQCIHVLGKVTTHGEVLARSENQILFHNRFLFSIAGYGWDAGWTPRKLAFALQKLSKSGTANNTSAFAACGGHRHHLVLMLSLNVFDYLVRRLSIPRQILSISCSLLTKAVARLCEIVPTSVCR
jgi:hypothetical protein